MQVLSNVLKFLIVWALLLIVLLIISINRLTPTCLYPIQRIDPYYPYAWHCTYIGFKGIKTKWECSGDQLHPATQRTVTVCNRQEKDFL